MKRIFLKLSNLHIQGSKLGGQFDKFGGKSFIKLNSVELMEFDFSKSATRHLFNNYEIFTESAHWASSRNVRVSVCLCVCLMSPSHAIFNRPGVAGAVL